MCTIMLGNPEMNLPGTLSHHDKGMQTIGVALKGGSPNQKHGFPPGGKSLESSPLFFRLILPLGSSLAL